MENPIMFLKYNGSKIRFLSQINNLISECDNCNIYIEPFVGSGAVLFNLERNFDIKIINDINADLLKIYNSFINGTFEELENFYNENQKIYGNWGKDKEVYYKFRNNMNVKYFGTNSIYEGFFYYIISRSCINSMVRWGKNGFNQGYGNRGFNLNINKINFNKIKNILLLTDIFNLHFEDFFNELDLFENKDVLWFIDPPYSESTSPINIGTMTKLFNKEKFLEIIKRIKGRVIYTDLMHTDLDWKFIKLRDLISISPSKKAGEVVKEEVVFYNW
jgi:DNA adenine methylase